MVTEVGPHGRRHGVWQNSLAADAAAGDDERPLIEDVNPEGDDLWKLGPTVRWHPYRVRAWIAGSSIVLIGLMLIGLFVLILLDVTGERLLAWQAALGTVMTLSAAATAYYFSRPGGGPSPPPG